MTYKMLATPCQRAKRFFIPRETLQKSVAPAKAGAQEINFLDESTIRWFPAFAGMTKKGLLQILSKYSAHPGFHIRARRPALALRPRRRDICRSWRGR